MCKSVNMQMNKCEDVKINIFYNFQFNYNSIFKNQLLRYTFSLTSSQVSVHVGVEDSFGAGMPSRKYLLPVNTLASSHRFASIKL